MLIVIEIFITFILVKMIKREQEKADKTNDFSNSLKVLTFYLILLIFIFSNRIMHIFTTDPAIIAAAFDAPV